MARSPGVLLVLALLAGCAGPAAPGSSAIGPLLAGQARLDEGGGTYAFDHAGGLLALEAEGAAQVDLWSPRDERVGQLLVGGAAGPSLRLEGLEPGTYVLRALYVDGTLAVRSGGALAGLRPLSSHVERHVLAQEPAGPLPSLPFGVADEQPVQRAIDLRLESPPLELRLLADASASSVAVELSSQGQAVLVLQEQGLGGISGPLVFLASPGLWRLGAETNPERVRSGHLQGTVTTRGFSGVLVLESYGYSRAEAPRLAVQRGGEAVFSYGSLPEGPVSFQTGPSATLLFLVPSAGSDLAVVLFSAAGQRLGLATAAGKPVAVPVAPATPYLAFRVSGNGSLAADGAPGDFQLHPVAMRSLDVPARAAGRGGEYGQEETAVPGLILDAWPIEVGPGGEGGFWTPASPCPKEGTVRLLSGNATVGYWGFGEDVDGGVAARLAGGPLRIVADGFGGTEGCSHLGARVLLAQP